MKDLEDNALRTSLKDEAVIHLKKSRTCLEGWDATNSNAHMSRIKQIVEETVQQYMENVATYFDSNNLPPDPKKLDRTPGALLLFPEPVCPRIKCAFQKIVADLKKLKWSYLRGQNELKKLVVSASLHFHL
ncbi:hypothetical protein ACP70R_012188 [Stipagrostis hirtigluma subsp. patula]